MITKQTAYDLWVAYDEIARGEKLLADMEEQRQRGESMDLRDGFGRRRALQLGVPSGESSQRLLDVQPSLAVEVIKAHIAQKKVELAVVNERARAELAIFEPAAGVRAVENPPDSTRPSQHAPAGSVH